jgi:hypothetical protein
MPELSFPYEICIGSVCGLLNLLQSYVARPYLILSKFPNELCVGCVCRLLDLLQSYVARPYLILSKKFDLR